jgi:hypothetical protein
VAKLGAELDALEFAVKPSWWVERPGICRERAAVSNTNVDSKIF